MHVHLKAFCIVYCKSISKQRNRDLQKLQINQLTNLPMQLSIKLPMKLKLNLVHISETKSVCVGTQV